jgi:hypothetical protein
MTRLYAAMRHAMLVATGTPEADDWHSTRRLDGMDLECVAAAPERPERAFCGTFGSGLQRTTDGGDTWERVGAAAIGPDAVLSVTVSPHDADEVWAGTEPSGVYRSTDGGETWAERPGLTDLPSADEWYFPPRPDTHHVRWIEVDPTDPERLYVGIEAGALVRSTDGGETWTERPPGSRRDNHSLATHPDAPGRVYAAAGDGYAESDDGGGSWHHPQAGLDHRYCWSVVPDPGDPERLVLSAASGPGRAHSPPGESYVYRREGTGPWHRIEDGLPTGEGVMRAVLATEPGAGDVYAVSNRGIHRSPDAGRSWHELDIEWPAAFTEWTARGLAAV